MARRWSTDEDKIIFDHYQDRGLTWVTSQIEGRSRGAVVKRAMQLGVKGRHWTAREDYVIRTCYQQYGTEYCRRYMLHRTEIAIMSRARRLGVMRDRGLTGQDRIETHDEIGCMQAAIKTGWMSKPSDLPEGFFELMASG
ncbi:MAG: hypothetical protein LC541_04490 [Candidatus Thiodiazotropha sp.]|nr:hypothetical protein [Candidatus Thiodiazotropha sp.]MCM8882575.1 hypothetical protein [Candidatus Thiodiazotropha sp.]MCM8918766.1 hypothetical protein [Candidatus Thiodiazotropha sp.]